VRQATVPAPSHTFLRMINRPNPNAPLAEALATVHQRMAQACHKAGRKPSDIQLLAVSKTQDCSRIVQAFQAGQTSFGENYVQEALPKIAALQTQCPGIEWHLIGPLQANKTRDAAHHFAWVHTLDRLKIAQRLNDQRPPHLPALQVCLQVNLDGQASKSGLPPAEVLPLAQAIMMLPRLRLRGLMSIPAQSPEPDTQRQQHRSLARLLKHLQNHGLALDTLSMGMSGDLEAAIAEGSTLIRVGTALFGERTAASSPCAQSIKGA
jgi:pyridoxal phosphate enzyme (YggS family)